MKKLYTSILLLFLSYSIYGQNDPELLGQWYLHYVEVNSNRTYVPASTNNPSVYLTFNNDGSPGFPTFDGDSSCNVVLGEYDVNATNGTINFPYYDSTLLLCQGDTFETMYLSVLFGGNPNTFNYTIDIPNESLTMVDLSGSILEYGRQALSTEENATTVNTVKLYPNPARETLFIADFSIDSTTSYTIYNLTGNSVITESKLTQNAIDINSLKAGVYFLRVTQQEKTTIKKFIKI
ncbi:T9SS type A sorting domain-containing protein [Kordia jejudonensis]|uniref:T9SS type A sorting domain-containing protein n=1 Tax=Kordia jejudonensis TaxID=1348245 RepID=UPI000629161F|nr:T9SS type A sorting domain-containing protein [Kordia jejudonensis]